MDVKYKPVEELESILKVLFSKITKKVDGVWKVNKRAYEESIFTRDFAAGEEYEVEIFPENILALVVDTRNDNILMLRHYPEEEFNLVKDIKVIKSVPASAIKSTTPNGLVSYCYQDGDREIITSYVVEGSNSPMKALCVREIKRRNIKANKKFKK